MDKKEDKPIPQNKQPSDKELLGGRMYTRSPVTPQLETIAKVFQQIAHQYKLTNKPLDVIFEPYEPISLGSRLNTIIRPILGVRTNKSENPVDWVVDYADGEDDDLAFCIKPILYKNAGISEYWVLDIKNEQIVIYNLQKNGYVQEVIKSPRRIKVGIYNSLIINYSNIF